MVTIYSMEWTTTAVVVSMLCLIVLFTIAGLYLVRRKQPKQTRKKRISVIAPTRKSGQKKSTKKAKKVTSKRVEEKAEKKNVPVVDDEPPETVEMSVEGKRKRKKRRNKRLKDSVHDSLVNQIESTEDIEIDSNVVNPVDYDGDWLDDFPRGRKPKPSSTAMKKQVPINLVPPTEHLKKRSRDGEGISFGSFYNDDDDVTFEVYDASMDFINHQSSLTPQQPVVKHSDADSVESGVSETADDEILDDESSEELLEFYSSNISHDISETSDPTVEEILVKEEVGKQLEFTPNVSIEKKTSLQFNIGNNGEGLRRELRDRDGAENKEFEMFYRWNPPTVNTNHLQVLPKRNARDIQKVYIYQSHSKVVAKLIQLAEQKRRREELFENRRGKQNNGGRNQGYNLKRN
ncbi:hypothetical protein ACOME3_007491 [Neoechinorhynchus agilis]